MFTNLFLADEINRTPPKTQAALLEAMEERQVTAEGTSLALPDPFVVIATENPVEQEGTYPLPEAQLDRFLFKLLVGYPSHDQEVDILERHNRGMDPHDIAGAGVRPVAGAADLATARRNVSKVTVERPVLDYVVALCRATRESPSTELGVSPRGATALLHAAKAWAWLSGKWYVSPDEGEGGGQAGLATPPAGASRAGARRCDRRRPVGFGAGHGARTPLNMPLVPTRRTALVAVVAAFALLGYPGAPLNVFAGAGVVTAVVLVVALVDSLTGTSPGRLEIQRRHPPVVVAGRSAEIEWTVRSFARRSLRVELADHLAPSLRASARRFRVRIPLRRPSRSPPRSIPCGVGASSSTGWPCGCWGLSAWVPASVRCRFRTELRVHPPFRSAKEAELRIRRARILEVGMRSARGLGGGTDFEQLREYGPDDEFRRIDWTATARVGKPIVRTYRAERNQRVLVLLDNGRVMAGRVGGVPRVEHAMDAAMMLTAVATRLGDRCGLVSFDKEVRSVVPRRATSTSSHG
ncbi:MAG: AAA family ATPase [Microthrixaceae bacterium]|nr:AAA family ATPase [Microthrixaceae bacterium]